MGKNLNLGVRCFSQLLFKNNGVRKSWAWGAPVFLNRAISGRPRAQKDKFRAGMEGKGGGSPGDESLKDVSAKAKHSCP